MQYEILRGDCIAQMRAMPDNSYDSIVCDPPYELTSGGKTGFMGKAWDGSGIAFSVGMWAEALRVLKPGGHLLAFSGSRTYHRMTCAIEDAGFEVRDQIMWVYGSGFPKSLDVSKAIDKAAGAVREVVGFDAAKAAQQTANAGNVAFSGSGGNSGVITAPATDAARQWEGWGTALKPAHEPICVARKPLIGTVAANVLRHGTGALNIDGCRVGFVDEADKASAKPQGRATSASGNLAGKAQGGADRAEYEHVQGAGRWPANLIHSGDPEVLALFPETAPSSDRPRNNGAFKSVAKGAETARVSHGRADSGSAARFFYCAKASRSDRGPNNTHPTVKPLALMQYLCRLVTPPGGRVLDPFAGSGSTIVAALREGFRATGIELLDEHADIIEGRVDEELYGDIL